MASDLTSHIYVYLYIYMYSISMFVYVYIYIHICLCMHTGICLYPEHRVLIPSKTGYTRTDFRSKSICGVDLTRKNQSENKVCSHIHTNITNSKFEVKSQSDNAKTSIRALVSIPAGRTKM